MSAASSGTMNRNRTAPTGWPMYASCQAAKTPDADDSSQVRASSVPPGRLSRAASRARSATVTSDSSKTPAVAYAVPALMASTSMPNWTIAR